MEKRAQGRPCRGAGEVGKQRIIENVRNVLRAGKCADLSRKSLALHIGVTPALITYYFPKKESLMEEVVTPVVRDYRSRLSLVAGSALPPETKLRQIIGLLAELYGRDAKILGLYRHLEERLPNTFNEMSVMTSILSEFFFEWRGDSKARSFDAAVLQGAVRGMCEFAERSLAKQVISVLPAETDTRADGEWLEPLYRLFTSGRELIGSFSGGDTLAVAH